MRLKTFYECTIVAKSPEARKEVANHLRYWPYVKTYNFHDKKSLRVCVNLGKAKNSWERKKLFERSHELIRLCLSQYVVWVTPWEKLDPFSRWAMPTGLPGRPVRYGGSFLRHTSEVRPFLDFIREMDKPSSEIPF